MRKADKEEKLNKDVAMVMEGKMPEMKPRVHFSEKDIPNMKKWKVGQTYEVKLKMKQVSMEMMGKEMCGSFEVEEVEDYGS